MADDGTLLFLVNRSGAGTAILLNVLSRDYQIWRTAGTEAPFRESVAELLREAGAPTGPVRVEAKVLGEETHRRVGACEIHRFRLGDAEYVGLIRMAKTRPDDMIFLADNRPKPVWIQFPQAVHVYDVRRGVYRGCVERFDDVLYPGRTEFFALLPYEVRGLDVRREPIVGGVRITARVEPRGDREPTTHLLRMEVFDPTGNPRRELARNVLAENGAVVQEIFIGFGVSGKWRVRVKDVATGTLWEDTFEHADPAPTAAR